MANILLGSQIYEDVSAVKFNTTDGGTVTYSPISAEASTLNIAYGDVAPEDTSMLWIKSSKPDQLIISPDGLEEANTISDTGAVMSGRITRTCAAAVGTKVYVFGGYSSASARVDVIQEYDTLTNTRTTLDATLPTPAFAISAAAVGTKIYLFGGDTKSGYLKTINVFDTETNTLSTLDVTLPYSSCGISTAAVGTKIYLFGGQNYCYTDIRIFDTQTNTITELSETLPVDIVWSGIGAVGTKVYMFGGSYSSTMHDSIIEFDTQTHTTTVLAVTLPTKMNSLNNSCVAVGRKIYLFGGYSTTEKNTILEFDTESHVLTTLSVTLPTPLSDIGAAAVGTKIYLFGGNDDNSSFASSVKSSILQFVAVSSLNHGTMRLVTTSNGNTFTLLRTDRNTVEAGVGTIYLGNADGIAEIVPAALYDGSQWVEI